MIYLDNAATSFPKPESVYRAMDDYMRHKAGSPGRGSHSLALAAQRVVDETRVLVARLINAPDVKRVIFTLNCTQSLNMALKGILRPGDHVVTDRLAHNALARPLRKLESQGVTITWLAPQPETGTVSPRELEAALTPVTRLIAITHGSNVTGVVQPVAAYGQVARRHGIPLLVDAAQTAGQYPIDVQAANISLLAFSGHKGLYGPQGTGVLYIGEGTVPDTLIEGGTGTQSESEEQPAELPYRYESGTLNGVGIAGVGAGIRFILSEGPERIRAHGSELAGAMIEGFRRIPGVTLYSSPGTERVPVVSLNVAGYAPGEVGTVLDQAFDIKVRTGLHCTPVAHRLLGTYPKGTVRFSPGYFTTREDVDSAVRAVQSIARRDK